MASRTSRIARLTLCRADGELLGTTASFDVPSAYWGDVAPLVAAARDRLGIDATVLRLLRVERGAGEASDRVTYLAETGSAVPDAREPADPAVLAPQPRRAVWAQPGGPDRQLAWAIERLGARGIRMIDSAVQVRTWNLSSIWRLPTDAGTVWLKAVPPFFAHEGAMIERLHGGPVPRLLARADGIALLADIEGDDLYEPSDEQALAMVDMLVEIQRGSGADVDGLIAAGLPDWRLPALAGPAADALAKGASGLTSAQRAAVGSLIERFDDLGRELAYCGIPDTLVHGDYHPGNVRGTGRNLTILDWGDTGIGHPLLDEAAFTQWMTASQRAVVEEHWAALWTAAVPGCEPIRAARLLAPVAALRQAVIYRHFLDHIEPDERIYHEADDVRWLKRTAERLGVPDG